MIWTHNTYAQKSHYVSTYSLNCYQQPETTEPEVLPYPAWSGPGAKVDIRSFSPVSFIFGDIAENLWGKEFFSTMVASWLWKPSSTQHLRQAKTTWGGGGGRYLEIVWHFIFLYVPYTNTQPPHGSLKILCCYCKVIYAALVVLNSL